MIQKHVRVDMPVIESFGTAGGVRRVLSRLTGGIGT